MARPNTPGRMSDSSPLNMGPSADRGDCEPSIKKAKKFTTQMIIRLVDAGRWPISKLYQVILQLDSSDSRSYSMSPLS